ncbi:MAG TPA: GDSL-type esterase/lipase family protein [Nitrolancea sp.]
MTARVRRLTMLPIVLLLLGLSWPAVRAPQADAASDQEYIALGDSIAAGLITSLPSARGFPALVTAQLQTLAATQTSPGRVKLVNLAVPGETAETFVSNGQLNAFKNEIASVKTRATDLKLVTITLGGNDLLDLATVGSADRQAGLDRFKTQYPAAINDVRQALAGLKPVIVVTTYYDLSGSDPAQQGSDAWWVGQFNDVIRSTAQTDGLQVADLERDFRGHITDWTWYPTDVHPNNAGHAEIARLIWTAAGFDQEPPVVKIVKPAAGQLPRSIPTIAVTANDNVGVASVELWVNEQRVSSLIYEPSLQQYVGVWDSGTASEAQTTLSIRAIDLAGHTTTATVTVTRPAS